MRSIALAAFLFVLALPAAALDPAKALTQFMRDVWQSEEGLPQNSVTAILQTRDGYLWLGTQEGLVRFDGVRFVVFDTRNTPELGHNFVLTLLQDRAGRLWIGTYGGLIRYENERFTRFTTKEGLPSDQVRCLIEDRRGRLWVGTLGGGVARFDGRRFAAEAGTAKLPGQRVRAMVEDGRGAIWLATDQGLARFDGTAARNFSTADGLTHNDIRALWHDGETLWIGTDGGGLNRLMGETFTAITTRDGLANDIVRALYGDRDGNLWIGTWGGGVQRMHGGKLTTLSSADGLANDLIWTFHEDRERSLWIGTDGGGLNRLKEGKLQTITPREGLSTDIVLSLLADRDSSLWIGTYGGGLNRLQNGAVTKIATANDTVQALHQAPDGALWIGTSGGGLNRIANGALTAITSTQGLTSDFVRAIVTDREGNLWVGTDGAGLSRIRDGKITPLTTAEGLSNDIVLTLLEDRAGVLWIGTEGGGLNRLANGKLTAITTRDGLSHDIVSALHEDAAGALWIGTSGGGLNRLKNGKLAAVTSKQGLFDDTVFTILDDGAGNFWMTCNKGIYRVAKRELEDVLDGHRRAVTSTWYGTADGMRSAECAAGSPAGVRTSDGRLWFSTIRGIVVADPPRMTTNTLVPPVVIERVLIDGKESDAKSLRVPPRTQRIEVHHTALSLRAPERVRFRYLLEGFDETWVDAGTRRTAYYTNVPHGEYRFRVLAANEDGLWNEIGATLPVTVEPRLTERLSFRLLIAVLAAAAIYLLYRIRVWQVRARERELTVVVEERTRSLRHAYQQIEEASLTDPLTGLRNRRYLLQHIEADVALAVRRYENQLRDGRPADDAGLVFFLVDVDHFKSVNDQNGHHAGDQVLIGIRERLGEVFRASDHLVRWGGEEFLIVARGLRRDDTPALAARTCAAVAARPFDVGDGVQLTRTCSVGFAALPFFPRHPHVLGWSEIVDLADLALYAAKRSGRNGWVGVLGAEARPEGLYQRLRAGLLAAASAGEIRLLSSFATVVTEESGAAAAPAPHEGGPRGHRSTTSVSALPTSV